jgi:hypothetical protein
MRCLVWGPGHRRRLQKSFCLDCQQTSLSQMSLAQIGERDTRHNEAVRPTACPKTETARRVLASHTYRTGETRMPHSACKYTIRSANSSIARSWDVVPTRVVCKLRTRANCLGPAFLQCPDDIHSTGKHCPTNNPHSTSDDWAGDALVDGAFQWVHGRLLRPTALRRWRMMMGCCPFVRHPVNVDRVCACAQNATAAFLFFRPPIA